MQVSQIEKKMKFSSLLGITIFLFALSPGPLFGIVPPFIVYDCAINVNFVHWDQVMHLNMHITMLFCNLLCSFTVKNVKRGLIKAFID